MVALSPSPLLEQGADVRVVVIVIVMLLAIFVVNRNVRAQTVCYPLV